MQDFSGVPKTLSTALKNKGYESLTPVQEAVSDPDLAGIDLLVSAQTGSGKTVGFGLAMAGDILDGDGRFGPAATPQALVITPTRELAMQVRQEFDWLFAEAGIVTASAVGGMDARTERRALERGAHVVVATPGRLRDHAMRGIIDLSDLRTVVLDEADEMLDMGFAEDLEFILNQTSEDRRTLLFSATVPNGITKLAQTHQKENAKRLKIGSADAQHADIAYSALEVAPSDIEKAIINLLRFHEAQTAIVFANTRSMVARLAAKFSNRGFSVVSLSGELSQAERTNALQALRDGRARVCVATDVAARGIDLPGLELVIHADLPSNSESLLHRSGRTGRAGRKGTSVLIVPGRQRAKAQRLLKGGKLEATWGTPPSPEDVRARDEERMLADPSWSDAPSGEERAFAEKLLNLHSAEQIAAAYLRLYRERHSAPELLSKVPAPGERPARKGREHADFGPSTWFSLSLGRKHRAEPRWLLPMLCRNTGLSKDAIGAIRVQFQETFVEIANDAVPAMLQELGRGMEMEQGAKLTQLPGLPDFNASPKGPPAAAHAPEPPKPDRKPRTNKPAKPAPKSSAPEPSEQPPKKRHKTKGKPAAHAAAETDVAEKARHGKGPKGKPDQGKPNQGKPKSGQPKRDGAKGKPRAAAGEKTPHKHGKGATNPGEPLGVRKPRQNSKNKGSKPATGKPRRAHSGDAKPFRKPSKRN
ncbi:DEAD/DEAH box helicase [Gymnodinialimonas hymeniacidonis]|uniref:DEAD/DEAH box helicase n=1 Tax=Gymnodinialimonas hymeniacidonis TaxID=3126508 RepID=UPI0034C5CC5A